MAYVKRLQKREKKIYKREMTLIIIISITIILFFSGYSIGKEKSNIDIKMNSEIAKPIILVENSEPINITQENNKGIYNFKIKNYDENGMINEVQMKYSIEIFPQINQIISMKLYKNEEEIELENNKTKDIILNSKLKQEENYKLEFLYDKDKSDSIGEIIENVQIKIHSEQVEIKKE